MRRRSGRVATTVSGRYFSRRHMAWFSKEFARFFEELEKNNNRDWFLENKKRYESEVKKPFELFTGAVIERLASHDKTLNILPKDAIFRINRDVRFSQDKSPYKTQASALINAGGRKDHTTPGFYFELNSGGGNIYGGIWEAEKDDLYRIREYIASHLKEFDKALKDKNFVKYFGGELHGEKNKKLPLEFAEYAAQQPLLYNKSFYYAAKIKKADLTSEKLPELMMEHYKASLPVKEFLAAALTH